jgi:hypothetical protein
MTNYKNTKCWKCDLDLVVEAHDLAERNYCNACAWDKIATGRFPTTGGIDV